MKITFKNVGQGDSIILESSTHQIGIIDCKKYDSSNPSLEFIKASKSKEILFIALSHPHFDHYSGMLELLQFCESTNVQIKYFIHTCYVHPEYLQWHDVDDGNNKLLIDIFTKVIELSKTKQIRKIGYVAENVKLKMGGGFTIHCISPSDLECRTYTKQVDLFKENNELKCSQAANLLSSVFTISNSTISILLTADAEKLTFQRLHENIENEEYLNAKLVLGQIPHHGSLNNHYPSFWQKLKYDKNCPVVISVGEHKKYNFPNKEVVSDFNKMDFKVYRTNHINGMIDFDYLKESIELSLALDMDSEIIEEYHIQGDQSFSITKDNELIII